MDRLKRNRVDSAFQKAGLDLKRISVPEMQEAFRMLAQESWQDYKPHAKQKLFYKLGKKAKQRLFLGGNRTGKTLCACIEVAMHLTGLYPKWWMGRKYTHPVDVWVSGVTRSSTKTVLQDQYYLGNHKYIGYIPDHLVVKKVKSHHIPDGYERILVKHVSGDLSCLEFKSYDQGREKFQGTKQDIIHFDEEPPYPVYIESLMRTMGTSNHEEGMVLLTMTPLKGMTEMVQPFMDLGGSGIVQESRAMVQASWEDNPHLSQKERKHILGMMKPSEQKARQMGIPSLGSGMVYGFPLSEIVIPAMPIPPHWQRCYGIDFGFTSPTAVIMIAYDRSNDMAYVYGEYKQTEKAPKNHAWDLKERFKIDQINGIHDPSGNNRPQSGEKSLVNLYRDAGVKRLRPASRDKELGLMTVFQRFQNGQLKIFAHMTETIKELQGYARDDKGDAVKHNDHLMDALRYAITDGLAGAQPLTEDNRQYYTPLSKHAWMGT